MHRIYRAKLAFIVALTAGLLMAGYEARSAGYSFWGIPSYVVAALSVGLGATLATIIASALLSMPAIRALFCGSSHVEGYWFLQTKGSTQNMLSPDGILYLSHDPEVGETKVVTTRLDSDGAPYPTESEIAYVRSEGIDIKYVNYFRLTAGEVTRFGLSSGTFVRTDDFHRYPDQLTADISLTGVGEVQKQRGQRIAPATVEHLKRRYGDRWKEMALKGGRAVVFPDAQA